MSSFVAKDLAIFQKEFEVISSSFYSKNKYLTPLLFLRQKLHLLRHIFSAKVIVCQFGGYHSFLPAFLSKLFSKPCLIVLGGTDCVAFPSIRYGNFNKKLLGWFTRVSYKLCAHLLPVHKSLILCDYTYQSADYPKQGVLYHVPDLKTPYTTIFNGYEPEKFFCSKTKKRERFITVSAGLQMPFTRQLKGIDLIVKVAPYFPNCEFVIVGAPQDLDLGETSANIIKIPFVKNEQLPEYYSESAFYLQLSMSEGFPNALCEAMLCECVPIVSAVGAMPDIVGDTGYVLKKKDVEELKELISKALERGNADKGEACRNKIVVNYLLQQREKQLLSLLGQCI